MTEREKKSPRNPWTPEQLILLHSLYADKSNPELAKILGHSAESISDKAVALGLKKSPDFLRSLGLRLHKNGPTKYRPLGSERLNHLGQLVRKVSEVGLTHIDWRPVHILLWEEHHGPVPENHTIIFKDGNKQNIVIENLECVHRSEMMRRNSVQRFPEEIRQLIQLRGVVTRKINKLTGEQDE